MPQPARHIVAVRRDASGRVTDLVLLRENGTKVVVGVDEAIRAQKAQEYVFFVTREGEAMLASIKRVGGNVVVSGAFGIEVDLPEET